MAKRNFRFFLICTFSAVAAAGSFLLPDTRTAIAVAADAEPEAEAEATADTLTIGSPAPDLDIEHWVQDGNGFFKPVTKFEKGKVYVVEFWATWCGPCIASMPHLAELQNKYRESDVQVVSVSDEPLETVTEFLERETETAEGEKTTFKEVTSAYCLTTDPDTSVNVAYMRASNQRGIPTAFLVGKEGLIEWIGHPMKMDEPIEQIVNDTWNRDEFAKEYNAERQFEQVIEKISQLAGAGKFQDAIEVIDEQLATELPDELRERWSTIRQQVKLSGGLIDAELIEFFKNELKSKKGDAISVARIGSMMYQISREQKGLEDLLTASAVAIEGEVDAAESDVKAFLLDTLAHVHDANGNLDAAIEAQQKAVDGSEGRTQQRLSRFLKELEEKKNPTKDEEKEPSEEAASDAE